MAINNRRVTQCCPARRKNAPHTIQGRAGPEPLRHCPGLPQRSIFPSLALFYRLGLRRRWWTPAFTQRSATHAGSFTAQSPPLNHLHLIIFSILAFGPATKKKKATDKQQREPPQNSQSAGRIWEWPHLLGSKHSQLPPTQLTSRPECACGTCGWLVALRMSAHTSARSPVGQPRRLYCWAAALSCSDRTAETEQSVTARSVASLENRRERPEKSPVLQLE